MSSELVEEVDEEGRPLRVVTRAAMRAGRLRHRCVYLLVVHDGRLLVHERSDDKDVFPGWWDVAAGGVVGAGEAWNDAARRELAEELGVEAPLEDLGQVAYEDERCAVVGRVYAVAHTGPRRPARHRAGVHRLRRRGAAARARPPALIRRRGTPR